MLSLYSSLIPNMLQILGAVQKMIDKAEVHCDENRISHADIISARLAEDMHPFAYQIQSCWTHSALAIAAVRKGVFAPDTSSPSPDSFEGLRAVLVQAVTDLKDVSERELEEIACKDMKFAIPGIIELDFTAQEFLMSFSQPNFYFHATTAYDILRMKGLPLGKMDYLGELRLKVLPNLKV